MKRIVIVLLSLWALQAQSQEKENIEEKGFKKENLFSGGSVTLSFYNNSFLIGGNPMIGYNITKWLDAGLVANYNYASYRDVSTFNDRLRQKTYGGGAFTKIYPVKFLFAQAQLEHNFVAQKYKLPGGSFEKSGSVSANSLLVGGGYTTSRYPGSGQPFFYISILYDVMENANSPYTDIYGRSQIIYRAGVQIPLFQPKNKSTDNPYYGTPSGGGRRLPGRY